MNKDATQLNKIYTAVQQMVANKESPDYINTFLEKQGESPETIRSINQYGLENVANARQVVSQEQEKQSSIPAQLERIGKNLGAGVIGGLKGALGGTERALQGASMGGYGWLSDKLGLDYSERQKELSDVAKDADLSNWLKAGNLMAELGGAIKSPVFKVLPNPMAAETTAGTLARGALQGGVASGLQSAFTKDSLQDVPKDMTRGAVIGGAVPVVIRGAGRLSGLLGGTTTNKGEQTLKTAYFAGQRGSKAFKEGKSLTAEEIVKTAQEGRDAIQKEASRVISEGKNAIATRPVDKQGLYDSLRQWAQERFLYNNQKFTSKGEQKVLKEAETLINRLTRKKNIDVKTVDFLKQQIYKIVPETSNDRSALAARDAIYGKISEYLNKAAPEYSSVMRPYQAAMNELGRIATETGVKGSGTQITSAINKLVKTSKNPETAKIIQKIGGQDLVDRLAGYDLRNMLPDTQLGRMAASAVTGLGFGTGGGALAWLPLMSPRLVGNTAYSLGQLSNVMPSAQSTANILNYLRLRNE